MIDKASRGSGYRLERVYVAEQQYSLVEPEEVPEGTDPDDREVQFGWDWRPVGPKRFEIIIDVLVSPTSAALEHAHVRLVGIFEAFGDDGGLKFVDFIKQNGPAILFPYAREVVSTMTGRGLYGSFHLNPINVATLLEGVELDKTTGFRFLEANPDEAKSFALEYRTSVAT